MKSKIHKNFFGSVAKLKPEWVFVFFGVIFGLSFCYVTPIFHVSDEPAHIYRAIQLSRGTIIPTSQKDSVPAEIVNLGFLLDLSRSQKKLPLISKTLLKSSLKQLDFSNNVMVGFAGSAVYSPLLYIPQTISVYFSRLLDASPVMFLLLMRLFNLSAWLLLTYFAIRIIPYGKWAIVTLSLMPMTLFEAASASADATIISFCALSVAVFLRTVFRKEKMTRMEYLLILAVVIFLSMLKVPYFFLALMLLLVPRDRFATKKMSYLFYLSVVLAAILPASLWLLAIKGVFTEQRVDAPTVVPAKQIQYLLENPLRAISVTWFTLSQNINYYFVSFIGKLGWNNISLSGWIVYPVAIFNTIALIGFDGKNTLSRVGRLLLMVLFILICLAISFLLYIAWTPPGLKEIWGIQGRYFIPVAFLLIPILSGIVEIKKYENWFKVVYVSSIGFFLLASIVTVFVRYY